jgi:hypothetical protein
MSVIINPGSGPVDDTTEANAIDNIRHYIADCEIEALNWVRIPEHDYGQGRYAFLIWKDNQCWEIQMPGLPLDKVRYVGQPQNIWDYPRLYINGSSWVWCYALLKKEDETNERNK